jgi:hypothetical protein
MSKPTNAQLQTRLAAVEKQLNSASEIAGRAARDRDKALAALETERAASRQIKTQQDEGLKAAEAARIGKAALSSIAAAEWPRLSRPLINTAKDALAELARLDVPG